METLETRIKEFFSTTYGKGSGLGSCCGYSDSSGVGYGSGNGYGSGYGFGDGDGYICGDGSGNGKGFGSDDGCGYGSGKELIKKAYADSEENGKEYERVVRYVESILAD